MGRLVRSEVEQAKQAFSLRDVELAEDLVRQDEQVNASTASASAARSRSGPTPTGASGR